MRQKVRAEIAELEKHMDGVGSEFTIRFTEPDLLRTHSTVSIQHRYSRHKERGIFAVARVKAINENGETYFLAILERI